MVVVPFSLEAFNLVSDNGGGGGGVGCEGLLVSMILSVAEGIDCCDWIRAEVRVCRLATALVVVAFVVRGAGLLDCCCDLIVLSTS